MRIYAMPSEQIGMFVYCLIFIGFPTALFLSLMPIWESFGRLPLISTLLGYIAPAVARLDFTYRSDSLRNFPLKRFFVAAIFIVALLLLSNFLILLSRRMRRRALMVWLCFDRERLLLFTAVSGLVFVGTWWLLFFDWTVMDDLAGSHTRGGARLIVYTVAAAPFAALVFGHQLTIVAAGVARDMQEKWRHLRRRR